MTLAVKIPIKTKPIFAIELYANNLLIFFWLIAAVDPKIIEIKETMYNIWNHASEKSEKGIYLLCLTSNKSAIDFQYKFSDGS